MKRHDLPKDKPNNGPDNAKSIRRTVRKYQASGSSQTGSLKKRVKAKRNAEILAEFKEGKRSVADIASRFAVSTCLVSQVAKAAGLEQRRRGPKERRNPSFKAQAILKSAWRSSGAAAAAKHNVSKQCVSQLAKRWGKWATETLGLRPRKTKAETPKKVAVKKPVRKHVVTFRLSSHELEKLKAVDSKPGNSPFQIARELVLRNLG